MPNILPDSRLTKPGAGINRGAAGTWQPIFCAQCGCEGGMVPEENMTFAFWLCNPCFASHGHITTTYVMPDEVFWARLVDEQREKYGRILTVDELQVIVDANSSPLATLIKEGR